MILLVSLQNKEVKFCFYPSRHFFVTSASHFLAGLDSLLKKEKTSLDRLKGIVAIFNESSFSVARQITAVLNVLIFVLGIKAVSLVGGAGEEKDFQKGLKKLAKQKRAVYLKPYYSHPPNITISKKKFL